MKESTKKKFNQRKEKMEENTLSSQRESVF